MKLFTLLLRNNIDFCSAPFCIVENVHLNRKWGKCLPELSLLAKLVTLTFRGMYLKGGTKQINLI